ncbi:MAG: nicotinate-nucleotide adenylyltransferase [Nitrospirota bacterium]
MKIGLFGGAFNPIHRCHLTIATQTRDRLGLDRLVFIPSGDPPHKPSATLAPAPHRLEMVRLAIADEPTFSVSEVETSRPAKSYSIDTVRALRAEYGPAAELFFIIGLDAFLDLPTWREPEPLLRSCRFVVVPRPPVQFRSLTGLSLLPPLDAQALSDLEGRRAARLDVSIPGGGLILLALPPCGVSASDIRDRIRRRLSLSNLLPAPVESYIMRFRLYQEERDRTGVQG